MDVFTVDVHCTVCIWQKSNTEHTDGILSGAARTNHLNLGRFILAWLPE
jgi:hypothetical protein